MWGRPRRRRQALPAYYRAIARPLDLRSIERALGQPGGATRYRSVEELVSDVDCMFTNALAFNQDTSQVYADAARLRRLFCKHAQASTAIPTAPK